MTNPVPALLADLAAEHAELDGFLADQLLSLWDEATPAPGWTVRDQISHLAHFDAITRMCIAAPAEFVALRDSMGDLQTYVDAVGPANAGRTPAQLREWWRTERAELIAAATRADPKMRVPWFGPDMSLASKLTARIMETWAHGQDVYDTVGATRVATDRLRHVARIGVLAFPNSFRTRGLSVPDAAVSVRLTAPDGAQEWTWGEAGAADSVRGPAEDFCLVVTQRRHVEDTALVVRGPTAQAWMTVAQAFAGPLGVGRRPGQFRTARR